MAMIRKRAFLVLAVGVLMGAMAVVAFAEAPVMQANNSADSYVSNDVGANGLQSSDAWEVREAMETGALPSETVGSSDAVCCRGIDEPTIEGGGLLFRPEIDTGS